MYFDALTTAAVADELRETLCGGRVQNIVQIDEESIGMEIYAHRARRYLFMTAVPQSPRAHLVPGKLRRGVNQPATLLLRMGRLIEGARLRAVSVPDWERVLHLDFEGREGGARVTVECIERRGNIVLADEDGMILECIRRVGPEDNRVRLTLPGHRYTPPPPQTKHDPTDLTPALIESVLQGDPGKPTWRALVQKLLGISPLLAREIAFRAAGDAHARAADTSAFALQDVIETILMPVWEHEWKPCLIEGESGGVKAFAPYPLTHLEGARPVDSISEAVETYFGAPVGEEAYEAGKAPVREAVEEARARVRHKLESLERSQRDPEEIERLRKSGELILAYQYDFEPGQERLSAQYEVEGPEIDIKLDPTLTPVENAQAYFKRYEKAKNAAKAVPRRIRSARHELAFLDQLTLDIEMASNWPEIEDVRETLQAHGYARGARHARPKGGKPGPRRIATEDGFIIWVGRNARQNDDVTFSRSGPEDLWLHVRGGPGAHVIIKNDGRPIPPEVIEQAAKEAARHSPLRGEARVLVDVTRRKYVRKIKGGKLGMVTYRSEEPVEVTP